jgi:hypothetical protein
VTITGHGLTVGSRYYTSTITPGALTTSAPAEGSGLIEQEVLVVTDANVLLFQPDNTAYYV